MALYSSGRTSGVVLDSGDGVSHTVPIYEGYAIPHSYMRFDFGGRNVTEYLQTLLKRVGYSFNTTAEFEIVRKIKETLCYSIISSSSNDDNRKLGETGPSNYSLPDGNYITLKEEKVIAPEILFNPSIIGLEYMCK